MMTKSNNSAAMLARDNFGYGERDALETAAPVVFVGEEEMAP